MPADSTSVDSLSFVEVDGVSVVGALGVPAVLCDHRWRIVATSPPALLISGSEPGELVGRDLGALVHADDRSRLESHDFWTALPGELVIALRLRTINGGWVDATSTWRVVAPSEPGGRPHTVGTFTVERPPDVDAEVLDRTPQLSALVANIQRRFDDANPDDDEAITWALGELSQFLHADRGYVVRFDWGRRCESMTHEWCRPGIASEINDYQNVSFDRLPATWDRTMTAPAVAIADVSELGAEWESDRLEYEAAGIRSVLSFSIIVDGASVGDLGLEWLDELASWTPDDLAMLGSLASVFAQFFARRESAARLHHAGEVLRTAFDDSPSALALVDPSGSFLKLNAACGHLLGAPIDQLLGDTVLRRIATSHHDQVENWIAAATADRAELVPPVEVPLVLPHLGAAGHGVAQWVSLGGQVIRDPQGRAISALLQMQDITEKRRTRDELQASEARFATLVDNLPDAIIRLDPDGRTVFANRAARRLPGYSGDGAWSVTAEVLAELTDCRLRAFATGTVQRHEYEIETQLGTRTFESRFVPEPNPDGRVRSILLVSADLTEARKANRELAHRASHDHLTDLPNRGLFLSHVDAALHRLSRRVTGAVAVVFLDLDNFKLVNDSLGHSAGDELIHATARRLAAAVGSMGAVARIGGDEFTVLLADCDSIEHAAGRAEHVRRAIAGPIKVNGLDLLVTASGGVAFAASGAETADELMAWADAAMYRAKADGRDRLVQFDDALALEVHERLELDQQLRQALENGEFEVHYQPEVDLVRGDVVGVEALVRWRRDGEIVNAADFIDMAEATGLIVPLSWWVLRTACSDAVRWPTTPARPDGITLRVNLSARQIDQPDLVARVSETLAETGLAADRLCLEITESALMVDADLSRRQLEALDALGIELAVDDFGTGYSSLAYLKQFPVDVLKIDRSFVTGLPLDVDDSAIVATVVQLAASLQMTVTAEGIEHADQAERLVQLGCTRGQGYYFARPMPLAEFRSLLAAATGLPLP